MYRSLCILLVCMTQAAYAQETQSKLHSPAEILKIMEESKLMYEIGIFEGKTPCRDRSDKLTPAGLYLRTQDGQPSIEQYQLSNDASKYFKLAETHFGAEKSDSARHYYQKVSLLHPDNSTMLTYIGQTYEQEHNSEKAMQFYQKAIGVNFYDYMAHWFLADVYFNLKKYKEAKSEITIAQILNRNNPRILTAAKRIYLADHTPYKDWCFEPQMELAKLEDNKIKVFAAEQWVGYAIPKAIWKYEPGYKENMGAKDGGYLPEEDKECLMSLAVTLSGDEKKKWANMPELSALMKAVDKKMFIEYLYFEMFLPRYPQGAFRFDKQGINEIKDYVLAVRGGS